MRGSSQHRAAVQAQTPIERGSKQRPIGVAALAQAAERIEHRQERGQIGCDRRLGACHLAPECRQAGTEALDGGAVVGIDPPRQHGRRGHGARRQADQAAREQGAPPAPAQVGAGQPRFGEDHVAQQPGHEKALPARPGRGQDAAGQTERAHQAADRAVDRRAFLRGAGEIDAAHARPQAGVQAADQGLQEFEQALAQHAPLLWEGIDRRAALAVGLALQLIDQAVVEALFQRREVAGHAQLRAVAGRVGLVREGHAPDLRALVLVEVGKELHETRQQVGLGHQHIDREADTQPGVQLFEAFAQFAGVGQAPGRAGGQQVTDAEREQHAVDRPARPITCQQCQETEPRGTVGRAVAVVGGVAPGGVDQHGLGGEPPVAVARAADALHHWLAERAGQRKLEPGIDQRGGLAGPRGADDDVPRQLIDKGAARQRRQPPAPGSTEARAAQGVHCLLEALADDRHLRRAGCRCGGRRRRDCSPGDQARHQAAIAPCSGRSAPHGIRQRQAEQDGQRRPARRLAGQRRHAGDCDQRADEPDQCGRRQQAEQSQQHAQPG